jgi:hypothetical protein
MLTVSLSNSASQQKETNLDNLILSNDITCDTFNSIMLTKRKYETSVCAYMI